MIAESEQSKEDDAAAAIACASAATIVSIVSGQDGKIAIREIIKILQAISQ